MKLLINVTGSISAYKVADIVSTLKKDGHDVKIVASKSSLEFIGIATWEGLTNNDVHTEIFKDGEMMGHISLARWADVICLLPASANTINKLNAGICDDLISSVFMANNFQKPYLIFPAMNTQMYLHPATQNSLKKLEEWGARVFPTDVGPLACGEHGAGRLLNSQMILETLRSQHV